MKTESTITTVTGDIVPSLLGICDAHNHLWIKRLANTDSTVLVLEDYKKIKEEIRSFIDKGGRAIVDCQPGECGRDGQVLYRLSKETGLFIIASTGFHLQRYYPNGHWLYQARTDYLTKYFIGEITRGLKETINTDKPVRAGLIKIAIREHLNLTPQDLLEAACFACVDTDAPLAIHIERETEIEKALDFFSKRNIPANRVIICHADKQPNYEIHKNLAKAGVLLEYDTFFRNKYDPDNNLWPLLLKMLENGFDGSVALATDMADKKMWQQFNGGPGLSAFITIIIGKLKYLGVENQIINQLIGKNIATRLAFTKDSLLV